MIELETPRALVPFLEQAHQVAEKLFRENSRRYDLAEHEYPKELDMLASLIDGMEAGTESAPGAAGVRRDADASGGDGGRKGANLSTALSVMEMCWGDVGMVMAMPRQALGNAVIPSIGDDEQRQRFKGKWAAMAITEPGTGSDSAAIRTTAVKDADDYLLNGEKIFVTSGERADVIVVWATLDPAAGRAGIKPFVVDRANPGLKLVRLEHKLGVRVSDTASFVLEDCRVPATDLLGDPEIKVDKGFGRVMETFDSSRPLVAAMAVGLARAALDETRRLLTDAGLAIDYDRAPAHQPAAAAEFIQLEADYEAARLLTMQAAWMADAGKPNSLQASMAKAKAGRTGTDIALRCVKLCAAAGYSEQSLLEKWARDAKIIDIFEGTQQIQLLIVARTLLEKSSAELK